MYITCVCYIVCTLCTYYTILLYCKTVCPYVSISLALVIHLCTQYLHIVPFYNTVKLYVCIFIPCVCYTLCKTWSDLHKLCLYIILWNPANSFNINIWDFFVSNTPKYLIGCSLLAPLPLENLTALVGCSMVPAVPAFRQSQQSGCFEPRASMGPASDRIHKGVSYSFCCYHTGLVLTSGLTNTNVTSRHLNKLVEPQAGDHVYVWPTYTVL